MTTEENLSAGVKPRKDYDRHIVYNRGYKAGLRGKDTGPVAPKRPKWKRQAWEQGYKAGAFRKDGLYGLSLLFEEAGA